MKATGIVRRIDELGRVVIPKEIRRTLRIREGDPLEIFTDREGGVILRKYSPIGELADFAKEYVESLNQSLGHIAVISDKDTIVAVSGAGKKDLLDKPVSKQLEELMRRKKPFVSSGEDTVLAADGGLRTADAAFPILSQGDVCGMFMLIKGEDSHPGEPEDSLRLAKLAASFLGRETVQ